MALKAHILIIEDETATSASIQEYLEIVGYRASVAHTADEAIKILDSNKIDLVVADIKLGDMDGLDLTQQIKKDFDVDVIVMTGFSEEYAYEDVIRRGASDLIFKPFRFEELILRLERVSRERRLARDQIEMLEKMKKLAITDGLTKLFNSRHFYNQLEMELDRSNRYKHVLALLLLDIDFFKHYNDSYGHLEGDKVLVKLGQIIKSCLRSMDSAYRYGGEEFTVILPETNGDEATAVAERIKFAVEAAKFRPKPEEEVSITISIGLTEYNQNEKIEAFVKRADQAMYVSKQNGRNRISILTPEQSPA